MTPEQKIQRGEHARRILDDPLVQEAMGALRQAVIEDWCALPVENKERAEQLKHLLWAANQFESVFVALVGGATMARGELLMKENMEIKAEAVKRRLYGT